MWGASDRPATSARRGARGGPGSARGRRPPEEAPSPAARRGAEEVQPQSSKLGGEAGIRTLDTAFRPYNGLANRRLQPLGHLTAKASIQAWQTRPHYAG